ncbi:M24 family metallopeptidase [Enterococcus sp. 669A]|uniref:M24 family metallopeptidase n=1 Tax=Candidatus Enterococcus moelleringii TaxID=2815325 RepID=A0ABS3LDP5_9ENTE|nr:aminopeptidase P family protein [Enterococcus sp. 669A]MBO1307746.1 M24 family metallopeptidase [Enterococcus sp. 669A]
MKTIKLTTVKEPTIHEEVAPVFLTDETMQQRKEKILCLMKKAAYDYLVVYADKEHGSNFEYLTGFFPRFEEGLLIINKEGESSFVLGNENLKMVNHARIEGQLYHSPYFSLPNQPMDNERPLSDIFKEIGLATAKKIGVAGWKMFTPKLTDGKQLLDLPYFIVEELKQAAQQAELLNACDLFISGEYGARTVNNANEFAHYEYGANLASSRILRALNAIEPGIKEAELGELLNGEGQLNSVVTIAAAGDRFEKANFYPTHKAVKEGDKLSLTIGYKGGLSSRSGFVIQKESELPADQQDYLEKVVYPYFRAMTAWLSESKIGRTGGELYQTIETVLPKETYGWSLNPGHLVADEEWMSSPIYPESKEVLKSGMIFEIDIIPSIPGYQGTSAEECVALADEELQKEIKEQYPELWARIEGRREYIRNELNIPLSDDILPLSNTVAYLRPFFLAKDQALVVE